MEEDAVWQSVLGEIELTVSRGNFVTWFKNTQVLRRDASSMIIGVPNIFYKQQLESKFKPMIMELLAKNGLGEIALEF